MGEPEGTALGSAEGAALGAAEGAVLGADEGAALGADEGVVLGADEGGGVGWLVIGLAVGLGVGDLVPNSQIVGPGQFIQPSSHFPVACAMVTKSGQPSMLEESHWKPGGTQLFGSPGLQLV